MCADWYVWSVERIEALGLCTKNTARGRKIHKNLQVKVHYYKYVVSGVQVLTQWMFIGDGRRFAFRRSAKMQIVVQKQVKLSPSRHTETDTPLYNIVLYIDFVLYSLSYDCMQLVSSTCYNLAIFHQPGMEMVGFSSSLEIDFPFFYVEKNLIGEIFREQFFLPLRNIFFCCETKSDPIRYAKHIRPASGVRCVAQVWYQQRCGEHPHTRGIVYLLTGKK